MTHQNILIGNNTFSSDWLVSLKKINKEHIILIDFSNGELLEKTIKDKNINYILPLSRKDYEIIKNKSYDNITILYPNSELFELLNNKLSFTEYMLDNFSNLIPCVYYLNKRQLAKIEFPVIFKPIYSTNGTNMEIYHNETEFLKCRHKIIIQKFIADEYEYSAYILSINGKIINWKVIRCKYPKYTIKTSNFSKYENVKNFDINVFEKIVSKLNYTGGMSIDFKFNDHTKDMYIFEINPRFGGSAFTNNFIYELLCI